jgi:hypothetical protein
VVGQPGDQRDLARLLAQRGFTVYLENRIMERVFGKDRAAMEIALGMQGSTTRCARCRRRPGAAHRPRRPQPRRRHDGRCPTRRARPSCAGSKAAQLDIDRWVRQPGLPADAVRPTGDAFGAVEAARRAWLEGKIKAAALDTQLWTPHHWLRFLSGMPQDIDPQRLGELDETFHLSETGNSEIFVAWAKVAIRRGYAHVDERVESFLSNVGRRKYVKPLYEALMASAEGRARAKRIYQEARPRYHAVTTRTLDEIVK